MTGQPRLNGRRRALRTAFQTMVALAVLLPLVVAQTGLQADQVAWLAPVLAVAAAISRVMAIPQVNDFLAAHLPWLAAADPDGEEPAP